jgi:mannose-6-phosphate isomerase-like protein (cupin superfamily)
MVPLGNAMAATSANAYVYDLPREAAVAPFTNVRVLDSDCAGLLQVAVTRIAPKSALPWEMHPHMTQSLRHEAGPARLVLETAHTKTGPRDVRTLAPGQQVVVPRGTWHTLRNPSETQPASISIGYAKNDSAVWEHE